MVEIGREVARYLGSKAEGRGAERSEQILVVKREWVALSPRPPYL